MQEIQYYLSLEAKFKDELNMHNSEKKSDQNHRGAIDARELGGRGRRSTSSYQRSS